MKDIAADLGLSIVTISKVLRNHPDIREETRQRVLQRIKELNYHPNLSARSLATGQSYLIGLVVPDLLHPFFAEVAKSLARALRLRGYSLIIACSEEDTQIEASEVEHLLARQIDGIILAAAGHSESLLHRLRESERPFLLLDRDIGEKAASFVGVNDMAVGMLATRHLIEAGCTRIAHIGGGADSGDSGRAEGYRKALKHAGLELRADHVVVQERIDVDGREAGRRAMRKLLALNPRPDGVFCHNDPIAIGAMEVLLEAGVRVPDEIALIGCGNLHYDELLRIPLSSVDQQSGEIGEAAARIILESITGPLVGGHRVLLKPSIAKRASTSREVATNSRDKRSRQAKLAARRLNGRQ